MRLTYSNVVSTICLFLLLGGGAYAATQLPRNSVGTKQLKKGAVTKAKIQKKTLKALQAGPVVVPPAGATAIAPGATLPSGTTLRGVVGGLDSSNTGGSVNNVVATDGASFGGYTLPSRPIAHIAYSKALAPPECPGSLAEPTADAGHLCVYLGRTAPNGAGKVRILDPSVLVGPENGTERDLETGAVTQLGDGRVSRFGFTAWFRVVVVTGVEFGATWAVTA